MALTDKLTAIADAIRSKTGKTEAMTMEQMVTEIEGIQTGGEKILYMDAALLDAGGAYPADADDYTTAVIPAEATFVSLDVFDNLPKVEKVIVNGNCEIESYYEYEGKSSIQRNALVLSGNVKEIWVEGRSFLPENFAYYYYPLSKVHISCDSIGSLPFYYCYALREAVVNAGNIPESAFYNCQYLENLELGDAVAAIGDTAFYGCSRLKKITIPPLVKTINYGVFYNCRGLSEVVFPKGLEIIDTMAFYCCSSLVDVVIPDGVTQIGSNAFAYCSSLAYLTIPESVTSIVGGAGGSASIPYETIIRGYAGSYAETYAAENGYTFEVIG